MPSKSTITAVLAGSSSRTSSGPRSIPLRGPSFSAMRLCHVLSVGQGAATDGDLLCRRSPSALFQKYAVRGDLVHGDVD